MNQPIAILSAIVGDDIAAGLVAVVSLAINTINNVTAVLNQHAPQYMKDQRYSDYFGSQGFEYVQSKEFQNVFMSMLAAIVSTINSAFAALTSSRTPLTTYILMFLLSYVAFKIVYGFVSWVVLSVINLVRTAIIISIVLVIMWFVVNVSSGGEGIDIGNGQRHQDPISQAYYGLQNKYQAEYARQQAYLHQQH
ncbi:hypothetical protein B0O80DRAFT_450287 [Mortierella sp. GBAus27b]|nr:hypothetical protein BGX31_010331 [Mortierella sp. GBA43]KAI8354977.1 hypothetical protein B0O80DRAFT_450287 [Mortierella sp. GBAus27b]